MEIKIISELLFNLIISRCKIAKYVTTRQGRGEEGLRNVTRTGEESKNHEIRVTIYGWPLMTNIK